MNILVARTEDEIDSAFEHLNSSSVLGCDTETSGLSSKYGKLYSVQFSDSEFNVLVPISEGVSLGKLAGILEDPNIIKIFHNAKFDLEFLHENGYCVRSIFDTMIAERVLTKGANQSASLAETLYRYFAVDLEKSHRKVFTKKWDGIWTEELVEYALSDVIYLPELMKKQNLWLEQLGLLRTFQDQMTRILNALQNK